MPQDSSGVLWYHVGCLCICQFDCHTSVHPYFCFQVKTWVMSMDFHQICQNWCVHWYVEIWFGIANGQILSIFWQSYLPAAHPDFHFWMITLFDNNGLTQNVVYALILWRSSLGLLDGKFRHFFDSYMYLPAACPYFHFRTSTLVNVSGFSPKLVCALILWTSALGLLMGKFHQVLTELSTWNTSVF